MAIAPAWTGSMFRNRAILHRIPQCLVLMTILAAVPAYAEQSFDSVAGSWSGGGSMKPSDGPRERVRCKIDYAPKNAGQSVKMNVRCASDAYKMDLNANIDQNGTALSGNWFESQYRQGGIKMMRAQVRRGRRDEHAQGPVVKHQPRHDRGKQGRSKGHLKHCLIVGTHRDVVPAPQGDGKAFIYPRAQPLGFQARRRRIVIDVSMIACDLAGRSRIVAF